jgi:hypothetical protein
MEVKMKQIVLRVFAVFGYSSLAMIGGASMLGVSVIKGAALAGIVAASQVIEKLARAYADDGQITKSELNEIFGAPKSQ